MPTLILLRHAKSDYPPGVADHDRPLSARGVRNAARIGERLRDHIPVGASVGAAISTATRTLQTWQIVRADFEQAGRSVDQSWEDSALYLAEPAALVEASHCFRTDVGILVGHNPGLEELALSIPGEPEAAADMAVKFPTAAFAVIHIPGDDWDYTIDEARLEAFTTCR